MLVDLLITLIDRMSNICSGVKHFQLTRERMIWYMLMAFYHLKSAKNVDVLLLTYSWKLIASYDQR